MDKSPSDQSDRHKCHSFRTCGVDVSVDDKGTLQSAVARTVLYDHTAGVSYETKIVFGINNGIAKLRGYVEPNQPSIPHFKTVPIACEQVAKVTGIKDVEPPIETLGRQFTHGREIYRTD